MITLTFKNDNNVNKKSSTVEVLDASILGLPRIFEMLESPDLFGDVKTYKIIRSDESDALRKELFESLTREYSLAHHAFIVLDKILAPERKKIESFVMIQEDKLGKMGESAERVNPFALGNALALGDRKKAWMLFQEIMHYDDEVEKTHGLVWWKIKDLFLKKSDYSQEELVGLARDLVAIYHEARLGGNNMKDRLEYFFLTLPAPKK